MLTVPQHNTPKFPGSCGLDDVAVVHGLFDAEGRMNARHHNRDEGVGHPTAGADVPPKAKAIVHGSRRAWVYIGSDKASQLECEGI